MTATHKIKTANLRKNSSQKQRRGNTDEHLDSPDEEIERLRRPCPAHLLLPGSRLRLGHGGSAEPNPQNFFKPHPNQAPRSAPASANQCRSRAVVEETPNRAMDGRIGLAARHTAQKPRANIQWGGGNQGLIGRNPSEKVS